MTHNIYYLALFVDGVYYSRMSTKKTLMGFVDFKVP